ncbi:hypothetical protein CLAM6_26350 [Cobetia sp. AM6]|nr:hypothetical protein CLAM6_26350 [Cobetia sp. AM6]
MEIQHRLQASEDFFMTLWVDLGEQACGVRLEISLRETFGERDSGAWPGAALARRRI